MVKAVRERALLAGMPESRPTQVMQVTRDTELRCYRFRATSSAVATTATAPGQSSTGLLDLGDRGKGIRPTSLSAAQWEEFSDAVALFQERLTAVRTFKAANTSWHAFDQYQEQLQEYERKLAAVAKEQGEIATQLQALSRGPVVQTAAAQAVRAPTVEGYFNAQLGRVITSNLAIYYIVRAVFQALYVLAGSLDQYSYTQMKQRPEQNLQSWGGQIEAMSKHFPTLTDAAHASIYVEGIQDKRLREELNAYRLRNQGCNDLGTLLRVAQNLVNNEVSIVQERVRAAPAG